MRVLHVAPSIAQSYGGPTNSLAGYAVASRHAGIEVSIAAPRCAPADLDAFVSRSGVADIHLFRSFGAGAFAFSPRLIRWIHRVARSFDVVHVHGLFNPTSSLSARAALRVGAVVVLRPFGTLSRYTFHHRRTALKKVYLRVIERRNLREAAALHFTTETERSEADWHGIDFTGRAYVVPPPAPGGIRHPLAEEESGNGPRVLFLGRINPVKNIEPLLDAWLFVRRKVANAVLEIAGDGDPHYLAMLHHRVVINGITNAVVFRGFVSGSQKDEALASASLLVLPSHHENFGVVVLEALEAGVPVVVSPDVHLADFVRDKGVGKVAAANPAILADAILDVLGDEEIKRRVRELGPGIVAESFAPSTIGELLSKMYHAAIEYSGGVASP